MIYGHRKDHNDSQSRFPSLPFTCKEALSHVDVFFAFSGGCLSRTCGPSEWTSGFKDELNPKHEIQSWLCLFRQLLSVDQFLPPGSMDTIQDKQQSAT